ncbi:MAG TPA: hypothetical protein VFP84_34480 [Kofleriaceae bacterium]|nr:hypothetical protein [Kofleriaceae bacterium]
MRRVVLTLLIAAVLLPAAVFARIGFLCQLDGQLRAACCCPDQGKRGAEAPATLRAACCCTRLAAPAPAHPPAAHEVSHPPAFDLVAVVEAPLPLIAPTRRATLPPRALAPPDPDRSLFARHCALLL